MWLSVQYGRDERIQTGSEAEVFIVAGEKTSGSLCFATVIYIQPQSPQWLVLVHHMHVDVLCYHYEPQAIGDRTGTCECGWVFTTQVVPRYRLLLASVMQALKEEPGN